MQNILKAVAVQSPSGVGASSPHRPEYRGIPGDVIYLPKSLIRGRGALVLVLLVSGGSGGSTCVSVEVGLADRTSPLPLLALPNRRGESSLEAALLAMPTLEAAVLAWLPVLPKSLPKSLLPPS
mmetsp:Transcript_44020/g.117858  ORF Transcript_44020/g.117858 Transcript_44020/m.117858 type:complete len:124 (+) Transcript_44020:183-554(+)